MFFIINDELSIINYQLSIINFYHRLFSCKGEAFGRTIINFYHRLFSECLSADRQASPLLRPYDS